MALFAASCVGHGHLENRGANETKAGGIRVVAPEPTPDGGSLVRLRTSDLQPPFDVLASVKLDLTFTGVGRPLPTGESAQLTAQVLTLDRINQEGSPITNFYLRPNEATAAVTISTFEMLTAPQPASFPTARRAASACSACVPKTFNASDPSWEQAANSRACSLAS